MPSRDDLAEQREQWIATVCTGLVGTLGEHTALDAEGIALDLGDPGLVRALVVARIAALAAGGRSKDDIVGLLAAGAAFVAPRREPGLLADLVEKVRWRLGYGGVVGSVWLRGCGLRAWSPESTYLLLLELWSARRLGSVPRTRVKRELTRMWGVQDHRWLDACLSRPPDPLWGYPDVWATLKAEPDVQAGNIAALGLNSNPSNQAWQRWSDRLPFNPLYAEHLMVVGGDLIHGTHAQRFLRRLRDEPDLDLRRPATRAMEIINDQLDQVATAMSGLSTLERELLRERADEEHFQDGCLAAVLDWSCSAENRSWLDGSDTAHGMWGPLPWWTITLRDDDQESAAVATLAEGTLPLGFERDPAQPDRLDLICRRPRTGSLGLRTHFTFDLTNPGQASELLLIGRRGEICIDVLREVDDEQDDPRPVQLGTLRVTAGRELAQLLTDIASKALKNLVPAEPESDDSGHGIPPLGATLRRVSGHHLGPWSSARELLVTEPGSTAGGITMETTEPSTGVTHFAPIMRPPGRSAMHNVQQPVRAHHKNGFVYVARNAAIPGMLKIGYSQRLPEDRADDLSGTPLPFPYEVLYRIVTSRAHEVEQAVHRLLAAHRVSPNREHFRVHQEAAEEAIRYCQELVTGIGSWEPMPALHRLRAGDRVTLPLKANQVFVITAFPHFLAPSAEIVDIWQAHAEGDLLELYVTDDPARVSGLSDGDAGAHEDPVPFLNRDATAANGLLIGRERLMAGDRLSWLSDQDGTSRCHNVVFEIHDFCQVTCRTWNPQLGSDGVPLLLNHVTRAASASIVAAVHEVLALGPPRAWAPRNPGPADGWVQPATRLTQPEHWLSQLRPRRHHR